MTTVKLNKDQWYLDKIGEKKFGKSGSIIDVDDSFFRLIKGVCSEAKEQEAEEQEAEKTKPLNKMNKAELIEYAETLDIQISKDEAESMTKADIIQTIQSI